MRAIALLILVLPYLACSARESSVSIAWDPSPGPGVVGYNIYRREDTGNEYLKINKTPVPEPKYTDTSVEPGKTYFYRVTAVTSSGQESDKSAEIAAPIK